MCFKGVLLVHLSCIWLFSVLFGFFKALIWPFLLMTTSVPGSPASDVLREISYV